MDNCEVNKSSQLSLCSTEVNYELSPAESEEFIDIMTSHLDEHDGCSMDLCRRPKYRSEDLMYHSLEHVLHATRWVTCHGELEIVVFIPIIASGMDLQIYSSAPEVSRGYFTTHQCLYGVCEDPIEVATFARLYTTPGGEVRANITRQKMTCKGDSFDSRAIDITY